MTELYPKVVYKRKSFKGVKKLVVPKQSMSLREILKRYVRREPLPGTKEGVYEERFGDIEKMAKADIVEQMESVDALKKAAARVRKKENDRIDAERIKKEEAEKAAIDARAKELSVEGGTPVKTPPPKGA